MSGFDIGRRHVGDGAPCFIMAEVGLAHDGSLLMAHAYIDAVAKRGVDAVKFQMHIPEAESWPGELWRVKPKYQQDINRQEYWRRTGFTLEQWWSLVKHAQHVGVEFLCSAFSTQAVDWLTPMVPAWKVPSGEVTNSPLLAKMNRTGKPVILSTGMSTDAETLKAMQHFSLGRLAVLQCTSIYPCPPEKLGLLTGVSKSLPGGLSDHSGEIYAGLAAVALGADILEVHVTFSKEEFGFDTAASLDMSQLRQLVDGVRFIEKAKTPLNKDSMAKELEPMRETFLRKHERKAAQ